MDPSSSTSMMNQTPLVKKKKMVKRPPARKQVEVGQVIKKAPEQTGSTFNVWYGKWAGGDKYDELNTKEKSQTRVNLKKDSGYTKADGEGTKYLCLFFARGCCPYGHECSYLHRLPPAQHELPDASLDVFGREKHSDYRDDMGGTGSFTRLNRTLYIGRLTETRNTADMVERHFEEFGEIERIKILTNRGVAFVTYVSELNAQFAKEAMMHQSLDSDEVLNVRWATEDPNPGAKKRNQRQLEREGEQGIAAKLDPEFVRHVRQLDELEGIVEPATTTTGTQEDSLEEANEDKRSFKRIRIDQAPEAEEQIAPTPGGGGILSAHAIESLKFIADLKAQNGIPATTAPQTKSKALGLGGLADYGSDSD